MTDFASVEVEEQSVGFRARRWDGVRSGSRCTGGAHRRRNTVTQLRKLSGEICRQALDIVWSGVNASSHVQV